MDIERQRELTEEFVRTYGADLDDYEKVKSIREALLKEKEYILSELNLDCDTSSVKKAIDDLTEWKNNVKSIVDDSDDLVKAIEDDLDDVDEVRKSIQEKLSNYHMLQCKLQYIRVVIKIESLSSELEKEYSNKDDEKCVTIFANLCEISRSLMDSKALHLREYLKETLVYWHNILREKLVKDFDEVLKALKWPFVNANVSLATPSPLNVQKLQILTEYLLQIELPEENVTPLIRSALLSEFPPLCLPIHYLVLPLRKRFLYHFYGGRQTNRTDKPEWYFTQILSWIRDHIDSVEKWVQPIIDRLGLHHIDAKLELMRGLVQLAVEKLHSELPNLQYDDFTFSHSVDEALGFDKELRETYVYPPTQPSILAVLTQGPVFHKWISMERKYAVEKMDVMLSSGTLDDFQPIAAEEDEYKVTTCADTFITLLHTITERYESLPQPGHRLQFLELQLELLDDFRVRLVQLVNAESGDIVESRIPMIANTIYYVENVLIDWGTMLHYLNLFYYKNQLENVTSNEVPILEYDGSPGFELETETVFADTLSLYRHMRKDLLCTLSESVVREAKARSRGYRRERWSAMPVLKEMRNHSLTPTACPIFEILARRLHQLQKTLAHKLFTIVWRFIAQELDTYLFEELVLDNRFNEGGCSQLKYDVTRNLFPLFSQFSDKPENYFNQLKESCELLNISKGSAILLRETLQALKDATGVEDRRGMALKEIGVVNFTPQMSIQILNQRTDITTDRLSVD